MTNLDNKNGWLKQLLAIIVTLALISCGGEQVDSGQEISTDAQTSSSSISQSSSSSSQPQSSSVQQSSSVAPVAQEFTLQENDSAICLVDGVIESDHAGHTGTGYINTDNNNVAGLTVHFLSEADTSLNTTVRFANGGDTARAFHLELNGEEVAQNSFAATGAWDSWQEMQFELPIEQGSNVIEFVPNNDSGLANIDSITAEALGLELGNCAVASINASATFAALNQNMQFTAQPLTSNTSAIDYYQWYFDGSAGSTGQTVTHSFDSLGEHEVSLDTVDTAGNVATTTLTINVVENFSPLKIYIAGDSTVSTYADSGGTRDQAGWGQMLQESFDSIATVDNRAIGGRTSRRFIDEGRLDAIWNDANAGDYLLVQFGTNDGHRTATYEINGQTIPYYLDPATDYKTWLQRYIDGARARDINLVFVTPPPRNSAYCTGGNGTGAHAQAMRELAAAQGVPLVDLNQMVVTYLTNICPSPTPEDFFFVRADGSVDGTHFQENGARIMSQMIAGSIKDLNIGLSAYLNN